jgi:basic amino acid/polyamine antiporter, APA family
VVDGQRGDASGSHVPAAMYSMADTDGAHRQLSVWDAISLIVGIVIGSSIFKTPPLIFSNVASTSQVLWLWVIAGAASFAGALVYAELATTYPRCGGEYNYLTRAFGPFVGFGFGWSQLVIIQTSSIGALALLSAEYLLAVWSNCPVSSTTLAIVTVCGLTLGNVLGMRTGTLLQNGLTILKLAGLMTMITAGLAFGDADPWPEPQPVTGPGWSLALILILYAYGGWNDAAFVAAEVRHGAKNIPKALLGGLGLITLLYLLVNMAYLRALGGTGIRETDRPAAATLGLCFGPAAEFAANALIWLSALGGVNGLIYSVSRLYATMGEDHRVFRWLSQRNRHGAPQASLVIQGVLTVGMLVTVGTEVGREAINRGLAMVRLPVINWSDYGGGFESLVAGAAPAFWAFFVLNAIGYFVLRWTDATRPRPFVAPLFPITPLVFLAVCGWMLYSSTVYARGLLMVMIWPLLLGWPVYWFSQLGRKRPDRSVVERASQ